MGTCHCGSCGSSAVVSSCLRGCTLVGIRVTEVFSLRYLVCPKFFLVGISWVQIFFSWRFLGFNFFVVANFVIQGLSVVGCMRKSERKQKYINTSQTAYFIPNRFQQLSVLFILERYIIYEISYVITQLSFVLIVFLVISFLQY